MKPTPTQLQMLRNACETDTGEIAESTYRAKKRRFDALEALVVAGYLLHNPHGDTDEYLSWFIITEAGREIVREAEQALCEANAASKQRILVVSEDGMKEWSPTMPKTR